ncbi:hypothetical protein LXL04_005665 [Taraxacum kok-saghyz]
MGHTPSIHFSAFIGSLVVLLMLTHPVKAGMYGCWGGCLNQCILVTDKKPQEKSPCYWDCLTKCFPPPGQSPATIVTNEVSSTASELPESSGQNNSPTAINPKPKLPHFPLHKKYYCIIGCSLQSCVNPSSGGIDFKICLLNCTKKCK